MNIKGFKSFEDADNYRCKLKHKELYGLFGICEEDLNQLWCVMPLSVLNQIMDFDESRGKPVN